MPKSVEMEPPSLDRKVGSVSKVTLKILGAKRRLPRLEMPMSKLKPLSRTGSSYVEPCMRNEFIVSSGPLDISFAKISIDNVDKMTNNEHSCDCIEDSWLRMRRLL